MTLITQSEFAKRKNVTRAAVTQWKNEGRIKMVGRLIDLEATEASMVPGSSHRSKRHVPARQGAVKPRDEIVKPKPPLNTAEVTHAPLEEYPASMSAMVTGGASDLAVILLRSGMPRDRVATAVEEWLIVARHSATELLEDDIDPPPGFDRWADHPAFQEPWLTSTSWAELEAEAARPNGQRA
jgi:hypothetical protein